MNKMVRQLCGDFQPREIKRYAAFQAAFFWGMIFLAWCSYPAEHHYSIMSHTFSFLGSFEEKHNPDHWYIFSIAMTFWAWSTVPLVCYLYRRFEVISGWGAKLGAILFLAGCCGVFGVALFPDASGPAIGSLEWTEIHEKAALLVAAGFVPGILCHGILLIKDRLARGSFNGRTGFNHRAYVGPYLMWGTMAGLAIFYQVRWGLMYAERKAAAAAAGLSIGSSWAESLNTRYAFPLWENLVIYTLFAFLIWFTLATPTEIPVRDRV